MDLETIVRIIGCAVLWYSSISFYDGEYGPAIVTGIVGTGIVLLSFT